MPHFHEHLLLSAATLLRRRSPGTIAPTSCPARRKWRSQTRLGATLARLTPYLYANTFKLRPNRLPGSGVEQGVGTYIDDLVPVRAVTLKRNVGAAVEADREFTESAQPHLATMLRLARRLGRSDAEDIVQESLARAWEKRRQFDPDRGSFGSRLLAITADQAYKSWRWHFRHARPLSRESNANARPDEVVDLEESIGRLPARQRLAIDCFYWAGLSVAETAAAMKCSEGTVKSTLSAARAALRDLLR